MKFKELDKVLTEKVNVSLCGEIVIHWFSDTFEEDIKPFLENEVEEVGITNGTISISLKI